MFMYMNEWAHLQIAFILLQSPVLLSTFNGWKTLSTRNSHYLILFYKQTNTRKSFILDEINFAFLLSIKLHCYFIQFYSNWSNIFEFHYCRMNEN